MSSLVQRIISATVALLVLAGILYVKGMAFSFAILFVGFIASYEFYKAFKSKGDNPKFDVVVALVNMPIMATILLQMSNYQNKVTFFILFASVMLIYILIQLFVSMKDIMDPKGVMIAILSIFYISLPLCILLLLSNVESGYWLIYLIFFISFSSDTFAYTSGRLFGKRKLAPKMSPNKTIAGSVGAIIGTAIVLILLRVFDLYSYTYLEGLILAVLGSVLAQIGDLTASILKRYTGIKDFGKLMPGHGGILDRLDSIIFVTPLVFIYYLINLLNLF